MFRRNGLLVSKWPCCLQIRIRLRESNANNLTEHFAILFPPRRMFILQIRRSTNLETFVIVKCLVEWRARRCKMLLQQRRIVKLKLCKWPAWNELWPVIACGENRAWLTGRTHAPPAWLATTQMCPCAWTQMFYFPRFPIHFLRFPSLLLSLSQPIW